MNFGAGETILVVGLGLSGQASVAVLRERGADCYITDDKSQAEISVALDDVLDRGARFVPPAQVKRILQKLDAVVISPGVPITGALVRGALAAKVPIFSEIEVAYRLCRAPLVAVTGTKGKSTATALIGSLLRAAGKRVFMGGNIGNPLISEAVQASSEDWVVAEVSSFQLECIRSFKPRISVILNISPDHLDRYGSMEEYAEAKFRILLNQDANDTFIGNLDDERLSEFKRRKSGTRLHARGLWFTCAMHHEQANLYLEEDSILYRARSGFPRTLQIMLRSEISLAGDHNVHNVMAALLCGLTLGIDPPVLRAGVMNFVPLPHRLQTVAHLGGITFVDDSKATNPGSVMAAMRSFASPIVLIAGGKAKGTDFSEMGAVISERAKAVVLIGEAGSDIAATLHGPRVERADSMSEAVDRAARLARSGDTVLLSPGCASFDMFTSAEDRGQQYAAAIRAYREAAHA